MKEDHGKLPKIDPKDSRFHFVPTLGSSRSVLKGKRKEKPVSVPEISRKVLFTIDYLRGEEDIRADILMLTNLRSELLGPDPLTREEGDNYLRKKVMTFQACIYPPETDYELAKVSAVAGNGWRPSSICQAVGFCKGFFPIGDFRTAIPLFTRYNGGKEVMTFEPGENGRWLFEFQPAELSGKFSKEIRVLLVRPI